MSERIFYKNTSSEGKDNNTTYFQDLIADSIAEIDKDMFNLFAKDTEPGMPEISIVSQTESNATVAIIYQDKNERFELPSQIDELRAAYKKYAEAHLENIMKDRIF